MTGQEKIDYLIGSINDIQDRLIDGTIRSVGAVGYASIGGVIQDGTMDNSYITSEELGRYLEAKDLVLTHDYAIAETAEQLFMQEHTAAMNNLATAVDDLTAATSVIMTAVEITSVASEADTKPEPANNDELTATVDNYAAQGNFMVGSYTAITYTQNIDEFVIVWDGFGTGFQGYLTPDMKSADDVYAAGEYIKQYGGYPTQ